MSGLKLNHVSKRGHWQLTWNPMILTQSCDVIHHFIGYPPQLREMYVFKSFSLTTYIYLLLIFSIVISNSQLSSSFGPVTEVRAMVFVINTIQCRYFTVLIFATRCFLYLRVSARTINRDPGFCCTKCYITNLCRRIPDDTALRKWQHIKHRFVDIIMYLSRVNTRDICRMYFYEFVLEVMSLQWHHNERDGVSNHQPHEWLLNRLFRYRPRKTSKLRVTGLCAGNSPVTGEFPALMASTAEFFPFDDVIMIVNKVAGAISAGDKSASTGV